MPIQPTIRTILVNDAGVSAIISGRVYDVPAPAGHTFPAIQLQRISEVIDATNHARRTSIQVDCYAQGHAAAVSLAEAVQTALMGKSGVYGSTNVLAIRPVNTTDFYTPENRMHRVSTDYTILWR